MTREEALFWLLGLDVSRGTVDRIDRYVSLLLDEQQRQNLISASTIPDLWCRHIVDSAQLLLHLPQRQQLTWVDVGSGAGFPGLIITLLRPDIEMTLIEPRRRRAEFLQAVARDLDLSVRVVHGRAEALRESRFDVVTARALASLTQTFSVADHLASDLTTWLLHKGRTASAELEIARRSWQGEFRLQQSVTDPDAAIVIATRVRRRERR